MSFNESADVGIAHLHDPEPHLDARCLEELTQLGALHVPELLVEPLEDRRVLVHPQLFSDQLECLVGTWRVEGELPTGLPAEGLHLDHHHAAVVDFLQLRQHPGLVDPGPGGDVRLDLVLDLDDPVADLALLRELAAVVARVLPVFGVVASIEPCLGGAFPRRAKLRENLPALVLRDLGHGASIPTRCQNAEAPRSTRVGETAARRPRPMKG